MGQIECKLCSPGTYVSWERHPGTSATDCKACPYGRIRRRNPLLGSLSNQHDENINKNIGSLRISKTHVLWSSKAAFTIAFFAAVNHNYDHKQRTLKQRNTQNRSKSTCHKSQTMNFWTRWSKLLFPKRSRQRQLAIELQNSRVFEKRSNAQNNNSARASN